MPATVKKQLIQEIESMPDELQEKMLKLVHFMKKEILSAKRNKSKGVNALLDRVEDGEEIIIAKSGRPVARLVPLKTKVKKRIPGTAKGRITIMKDFFEPLPEAAFYSGFQDVVELY